MYTVVNYDWVQEEKWTPNLVLFNHEESKIENFPLKKGKEISFKVLDRKFCIGYRDLDKWVFCGKEINSGLRCKECLKNDILIPCLSCDGTICRGFPKLREICETGIYYIYLTSFGDHLKVGVVRETRFPKRWIEQGADFGTRVIKIKNGRLARTIEKRIHKRLNFSGRSQVIKNLNKNNEFNLILKKFNEAKEKIKKELNEFSNFFLKDEIHDLNEFYDLPKIKNFLELKIKPKLIFSGKIIGVKGFLLFFENENSVYMINLKKLIGRKIQETKESFKGQRSLIKYVKP